MNKDIKNKAYRILVNDIALILIKIFIKKKKFYKNKRHKSKKIETIKITKINLWKIAKIQVILFKIKINNKFNQFRKVLIL